MLLIIHNLPVQMRYSDVRDFLISKSGIQQLILDNLIHEKSGSKQQVTVGLVDESDAAIFVRKINNLYLDGEPIYIENVGQKMELEQPYRPPQYHTQSRKDVESTVEQYSLLKPNRTDFGNKHALMISTLPPVGNIPSYKERIISYLKAVKSSRMRKTHLLMKKICRMKMKLTELVECNPPQDYLGMEAIEAFLKQRCGITAKITAREKIWMVCCESFDVFDKLCNVGKVFIGKVRVSFEPFKLSIHKNRPRYAEMQFLMSSSPEKDIVVPKYNNDDYFDDCKDFIIPTTEDNQNAKEAKLTEDDCNEIICDEKTVDGSHGVHKENVAVTPTNNDDAVVLDNPYENNPISDIICNIETVNRSPEKIELIEPNQDLVINEDDLEEF
ncbi:unnamed protein product [Leptidea sinapis]|uniref:RRM domain-containing protein n=1 Tax=Leptidea sinapis TaxID=189913 RepID=A0A5E4Q6J2_9NEOP|nr:unnamed protein product [Leptidea sinapis]